MTEKPPDFPFDEIIEKAQEIVDAGAFWVLQKYSCVNCGKRLTMDRPNAFWTHGSCEDCPGVITDIKAQGCNYMAITSHTLQALDVPPPFAPGITVCTYKNEHPGSDGKQ